MQELVCYNIIKKYKQETPRVQNLLFPISLDEYITANNVIRCIDAYIESIDLEDLRLVGLNKIQSGQPSYHPTLLLRLYLYGYMNRLNSSRQLEKDCHRNVELMWLLGNLKPCFKTIASFRQKQGELLKKINRDFILLCKELNLYSGEEIAVDGSLMRGNVSKGSISTKSRLTSDLAIISKRISVYYAELNRNDKSDDNLGLESLVEDKKLKEKLEKLKELQSQKNRDLKKLKAKGETQISKIDEDARLLSKPSHKVAGYNVQIAVDSKHRLIAESFVSNKIDLVNLYEIASLVKQRLNLNSFNLLADGGYHNSKDLAKCEQEGIITYISEPDREKIMRKKGKYGKSNFTYNDRSNSYICPAKKELVQIGGDFLKNGKIYNKYYNKSRDCDLCFLKDNCVEEGKKTRYIHRAEFDNAILSNRARLKKRPDYIKKRSSLAEHSFGTIKSRIGTINQFVTRGLEKVSGEWSLMVLGYNLTRVINIIGVKNFINHCSMK